MRAGTAQYKPVQSQQPTRATVRDTLIALQPSPHDKHDCTVVTTQEHAVSVGRRAGQRSTCETRATHAFIERLTTARMRPDRSRSSRAAHAGAGTLSRLPALLAVLAHRTAADAERPAAHDNAIERDSRTCVSRSAMHPALHTAE